MSGSRATYDADVALSARCSRAVGGPLRDHVLTPNRQTLGHPQRRWERRTSTGLTTSALFIFNHSDDFDVPVLFASLPPKIRRRLSVAVGANIIDDHPILAFVSRFFYAGFAFARRPAVSSESALRRRAGSVRPPRAARTRGRAQRERRTRRVQTRNRTSGHQTRRARGPHENRRSPWHCADARLVAASAIRRSPCASVRRLLSAETTNLVT